MAVSIGLDIGTQGAKAIAYDSEARSIIGRGSSSYEILPSSVPGRAEQWPDFWVQGAIAAVKQALESVPDAKTRVAAIGVSGQQHGLVVMDTDGQPCTQKKKDGETQFITLEVLRPCKLWCDVESAQEAEELSKTLNTTIVPSFTITKLLWLKRNEPEVWARVQHVLLPGSYINWWLCGRYAMEAGDASGTGLLDLASLQWSPNLCDLVDPRVRGWLPDLVGPNEVVGRLRPEVASILGLSEDVVVSPGSGDNACSALGVGLVEEGPLVMSLGTSGTLFSRTAAPILDATGAVCPFCDATGGGLPLLCTLNCTQLPGEVASAYGMSHEDLTRLAAAESPGARGVTFLPYLLGERTPNWPHASGALLGLRPGSLRPGVTYRAALEGATFSLLAGAQRMQQHGFQLTELWLVGGGAKNPLWRQIAADVFQLPVRLPLETESAALGAALQAAACHQGEPVAEYVRQHAPPMDKEVIKPNPEHASAYHEAFARFRSLSTILFDKPELAASSGRERNQSAVPYKAVL